MKKKTIWIALGVLLLLIAGAAGILATALIPLTVEAGAPAPAAADYARYRFLTPDGEGTADISRPGTYTVNLHLFGIPLKTTLTVIDTTPPEVTPVPQTCFLGEEIFIENFVVVADATAVELMYVSPPDFTRAGEQAICVRATDLGGNQVEVEVPLMVHAMAHEITVEAGTGMKEIRTQIRAAIGGKVSFGDDFAALDTVALGEKQITITVDGKPVKLTLTVADTTAPTGKPRVVRLLSGQTARADDFLRSVEDATAVTVEFAAEPDFSAGARTVELRLTDEAGNVCTLTSGLRVYSAPAETTLELGMTQNALKAALLGGENLTFAEEAEALLTSPGLGTHLLTLLTAGGDALTQMVTFIDTTPPKGLAQNRTAYVGDVLEAADFLQSVTDATAVTAAYTNGKAPDTGKAGMQTVSLTLTDEAGNHTVLTAALTVIADTEPPVLYGVSDKTVYVGETVSYTRGVSAWDNRDGAVQVRADASGVNLRAEGSYPVIYTATDAAGNTATKTVTFTVRVVNTDAVNAMADDVLTTILRDGMTQWERARAIYDWVVTHMSYTAYADKTDPVAAAYYGFRNGRGDCFVYYAVSRFLLTRAGFENLEIQRDNPEKPHFWNLVNYAGNWYHFDTCPHYAGHPLTCFLLTDAEVKAYSENHVQDYYSFDASLYPATP